MPCQNSCQLAQSSHDPCVTHTHKHMRDTCHHLAHSANSIFSFLWIWNTTEQHDILLHTHTWWHFTGTVTTWCTRHPGRVSICWHLSIVAHRQTQRARARSCYNPAGTPDAVSVTIILWRQSSQHSLIINTHLVICTYTSIHLRVCPQHTHTHLAYMQQLQPQEVVQAKKKKKYAAITHTHTICRHWWTMWRPTAAEYAPWLHFAERFMTKRSIYLVSLKKKSNMFFI